MLQKSLQFYAVKLFGSGIISSVRSALSHRFCTLDNKVRAAYSKTRKIGRARNLPPWYKLRNT